MAEIFELKTARCLRAESWLYRSFLTWPVLRFRAQCMRPYTDQYENNCYKQFHAPKSPHLYLFKSFEMLDLSVYF